MQSITHCTACQTQFVVTELQLKQHHGIVRCGHCLHVFNATEQLVNLVNVNDAGLENNVLESNVVELKPRIKADLPPADLLIPSDLTSKTSTDNHSPDESEVAAKMPVPVAEMVETISDVTCIVSPLNASSNIANTTETYQYDYLTEPVKPKPNSKLSPVLFWILLITLLLAAIAQSVYFLRHQIALYYPNFKPSLVQVCEKIGCSIDLPKKIESIVIDDSDIQEDAEHVGLMRLSTTLINQARFNQAYPNLELTLTDVEDKPKLRRIFKPYEYLPANTNVAKGIAAGEEIRVKLAMTTQGIVVAGYRVFVTY